MPWNFNSTPKIGSEVLTFVYQSPYEIFSTQIVLFPTITWDAVNLEISLKKEKEEKVQPKTLCYQKNYKLLIHKQGRIQLP